MKGKDIFLELYNEQEEIFVNSYLSSSRKIFYNPENKNNLHHAGEFGIYRERIVSKFLRLFTPQRLEFDSGFIITPNDEASKQTDIVVYDKNESPLIQSEEGQKFFPIETVATIGEIKSVLTKEKLKEALMNLTNFKVLRENIGERLRLHSTAPYEINMDKGITKNFQFNPKKYHNDQISTFLICERFGFEINESNVNDIISGMYEKSTPENQKVDFILSLENGFIGYYNKNEGFSLYPTIDNGYNIEMVMKDENNSHIKQFVNLYYNRLPLTTIVKPEVGNYFE